MLKLRFLISKSKVRGHKFLKNLRATSRFLVLEGLHESSSMLRSQ